MHAPGSVMTKIVYRLVTILFTALLLFAATTRAIATETKTIVVLGDSLSAAYGIQLEQGWVALLEKQLLQAGNAKNIINASISGETTDGGLRSLPNLLSKHSPNIVIIELGANDGLRGFPLKVIERNLAQLIEMAQEINSKVLLVGMHIPPNYGKRYANGFHQLFSTLADKYDVALLPFLLEGIAVNPKLMQKDKLHPRAEAQETIRALIWNKLEPLISTSP